MLNKVILRCLYIETLIPLGIDKNKGLLKPNLNFNNFFFFQTRKPIPSRNTLFFINLKEFRMVCLIILLYKKKRLVSCLYLRNEIF